MTKPVFLTLQRGEQLIYLRLGLPHLALALSLAVLAAGLAWPQHDTDAQGLTQTKWRLAALQSELEKSVSQNGVTRELLHTRLTEVLSRLKKLDAQETALTSLETPEHRLSDLDQRITRIERQQMRRLQDLTDARAVESRQIEGAMQMAGLQLSPAPNEAAPAQGGPFIPLSDAFSGPFAQEWTRAEPMLARHAMLSAALPNLPLRAPLLGAIDVSSGFGARMDPFHGRAAWHTGIDLRQDKGSDVLSAAAGTVTAVGWNGAYGLMVDVDHGNGLVTRYAHLSRALVREGDVVKPQAALGRSGATGRTTGAHLHYELRINGEPIDPTRLLKAGQSIASLLNGVSQIGEPAQ